MVLNCGQDFEVINCLKKTSEVYRFFNNYFIVEFIVHISKVFKFLKGGREQTIKILLKFRVTFYFSKIEPFN